MLHEPMPSPLTPENLDQMLAYISESPKPEHGGFQPEIVDTAKATIAELSRLRSELDTIKSETIEYVHDGGDFNWIEAVIAIRAWREELARLRAAKAELVAACAASSTKFDEIYASRTGRMPEAVELVRAALAKASP